MHGFIPRLYLVVFVHLSVVTSILVKDAQLLNIPVSCPVSSLWVSKLLKSNVVKEVQLINILDILVTLLVLNLLTFRSVSCEQFLNIIVIIVVFLVIKLLKSRLVREEQSINIAYIFFTFLVSKLLKSKFVREEHPLNMLDISVTFIVLAFPKLISLVMCSLQTYNTFL